MSKGRQYMSELMVWLQTQNMNNITVLDFILRRLLKLLMFLLVL